MELFTTVIGLIAWGVRAGGILWLIFGAVAFALAFNDHNGPGIQKALLHILGGAIVLAASFLFSQIEAPPTTTTAFITYFFFYS